MREPRIKSDAELELDIAKLNIILEEKIYQRTILTQDINSCKKQIEKLQSFLSNNNQIELY